METLFEALVLSSVCLLLSLGGKNEQSEQSKGKQRFVDPAHHDARSVIPIRDIAEVRQSAAHPPREHGKAHDPQHGNRAVQDDVEARLQAAATVQDDCEEENGYGEK